jgi:[ribosomal protein S5]-alanine N-acetyltransferase
MLTRLERDILFHPPPRLETERLLLEPLRIEHAAALFAVYADPAVASASNEEPYASLEATTTHIGGILKEQEMRLTISWALILKAESCAVGNVALHAISWSNRRGELGFTLASRLWRRGLMSEALRTTIEFCFSQLRFIKLCAQNTTHNEACHALLVSLGFQQEALLRQHGVWNGTAHDLRQYGLTATLPENSIRPG